MICCLKMLVLPGVVVFLLDHARDLLSALRGTRDWSAISVNSLLFSSFKHSMREHSPPVLWARVPVGGFIVSMEYCPAYVVLYVHSLASLATEDDKRTASGGNTCVRVRYCCTYVLEYYDILKPSG